MSSEPLYDVDAFLEGQSQPPSEEDMELFKQQVAEWLRIDDAVRKLHVAIRERRVHQRALTHKIQDFMTLHGYDNLNTQAGRIKTSMRTVKQPLKLTDVRNKILELGEERLTPEEIIARIFDAERPTVVKTSLRRVVPKVSLHLDL
jgi:hypothetical protein